MSFKQSFAMALRSLLANKGRALQAMLGVIIGVAAVFAIFGVSNGMLHKMHSSYQQYSPNVVWVSAYMRAGSGQKLTEDDMRELLADKGELYTAFSPLVYMWEADNLKYGDKVYPEIGAMGVGEGFLEALPVLKLAEGRFLQVMDIDRRRKVCVVGSYVADEIMGGDALGGTLKICGENYTVVGVLAEAPVIDEDWNVGVCIPYTNARQLVGDAYYSFTSGNYYRTDYYINASSAENVRPLREAIWNDMRETYGDAQITYTASLSKRQSEEELALLMFMVKPAFGALFVLLVGGAGIMNMMTAIVKERTPEIGVRKAFGATNRDIRRQFKLESACICLVGGALGILLGLPVCAVACHLAGLPLKWLGVPVVPLLASLLAIVGVGVIFGTYLANQAAKLEPVEALRYN